MGANEEGARAFFFSLSRGWGDKFFNYANRAKFFIGGRVFFFSLKKERDDGFTRSDASLFEILEALRAGMRYIGGVDVI